MKQSKYLEIVARNGAFCLVFMPTGQPLVQWVGHNGATVTQDMRLAEDILEAYEGYLKGILRR